MEAPLMNLTPDRGPSVWNAPRSTAMNWPMAAIAGGSLLAAYAWRNRSSHRALFAGLGLGSLACGLLAGSNSQRFTSAWNRLRPMTEPVIDDVDRASEDSFPASDAPALK